MPIGRILNVKPSKPRKNDIAEIIDSISSFVGDHWFFLLIFLPMMFGNCSIVKIENKPDTRPEVKTEARAPAADGFGKDEAWSFRN